MRLAQCLPYQPCVALLGERVGQLLANFAKADAGAGALVVYPQAAPVFPSRARVRPDACQDAKLGKGASAFAAAEAVLDWPTYFSISARIMSLPNTFTRSRPCVRAISTALR